MGPLLIIVLAAAILFFWKKNSRPQKRQSTYTAQSAPYTERQTASDEFSYIDKGTDILRHAPKPDPVRGFANFPTFTVKGKKKSTNRMNTRLIRCADEDAARQIAIDQEGLMEPLEINLTPVAPSPCELECGLRVPEGASKWDADMFSWSVDAHDTKHIPTAFMQCLTDFGIPMSWLAGRNMAARHLLDSVDAEVKATLYGYAVYCRLCSEEVGNILTHPRYELFTAFAHAVAKDARAYTSLQKRPPEDIWNPSARSAAYDFATAWLNAHM